MDHLPALVSAGGVILLSAAYWLFKREQCPAVQSRKLEGKAFNNPKLVLVARMDLKMGKGKLAAQCAHAAVMAYEQGSKKNPKGLASWRKQGQPKIVVKVDSEEELLNVYESAKKAGIIASIVQDAGRTQISPGSLTVVGVGPDSADLVDQITGHLKLC